MKVPTGALRRLRGIRESVESGLRTIRRRPGLFSLVVATLAMGIGLSTAMFSVADATILRPLPFPEADRLVVIWQSDREQHQPFVEVSYPAFKHWREETSAFEGVAGMPTVNQELALGGRGEPTLIQGRWVTGDFFSVLRVRAALGRTLLPEDDAAGAARVVVLNYALWKSRFSGDPNVIGRSFTLDRQPHTVVGVMPRAFEYPTGAEVWTALGPAAPWAIENLEVGWMIALGRLKPGATIAAAQDDMTRLYRRQHQPYADSFRAVVTPVQEAMTGPVRPIFLGLLGAVAVVLLICCGNASLLLMFRAVDRHFEMTVRQALGASRHQLARMLGIEAAILAICGGALGLVAARIAVPVLVSLAPGDIPRLNEAAVDSRALIFSTLAVGVAAMLSGIGPVFVLNRGRLEDTLRKGPNRNVPAQGAVRSSVVVLQVALAFVLVVVAGLLGRSLREFQRVPLGFDPERLVAVTVSPSEDGYPEVAQMRGYFQEVLTRARSVPGVESVAAVLQRPLAGAVGMDWRFTVEGQTEAKAERNPLVNLEAVSADYFRTMGIPLRTGRDFTERDREGQPGVAMVSEDFAQRYWPGMDPVGKRVKIPLPETAYDQQWLTIIGVAGNARYRELRAPRFDLYLSYLQANFRLRHLMVRTRAEPTALIPNVRDVVRTVDPEIPTEAATMSSIVAAALGGSQFAASFFGGFALVALLLAALGLYALVGYAVSRRTREIGTHMALGASRGDIAWVVARKTLWLVCGGLGAGCLLSLLASRLVGSLLFGVDTRDPPSYALALGVLVSAASAAIVIPIWRATHVDPAAALRED